MELKKKCIKCGTIQAAERQTCVDCGAVLPPAAEEFGEEMDYRIDQSIDHRLTYPLYGWCRWIGFIDLALLAGSIALMFVFSKDEAIIFPFMAAAFAAWSAFICLLPRAAVHIMRPHWRDRRRDEYDPEDLDFYADSYTHQFLASGAVIFFAVAIIALLLCGSALPSNFDSPGVHTVIADTMEFSQ